ncbi:MAG: LysE family translocator [Oscillochloris sp.]|nr:LysE family translocator [Oscillochloris sp.]
MPSSIPFSVFLSAAILLAITPGPGMFYVLARSLKGGRRDGIASSFGTAIGGMAHVVAAALGLSAVLATSALAFNGIKYAGAAYLIYLGVRTIFATERSAHEAVPVADSTRRVLLQGIVTEVLNPKTALFFLAFIPQFIDPAGPIVTQFLLLGTLSVALNTTADLIVVLFAGPIGQALRSNMRLRRAQQRFTGGALIALGIYVAAADGRKS